MGERCAYAETRSPPAGVKVLEHRLAALALAITVIIGIGIFLLMGKIRSGLDRVLLGTDQIRLRVVGAGGEGNAAAAHCAGAAVCYRANVWNIGAEGQFVVGAITAGGVCWRTN